MNGSGSYPDLRFNQGCFFFRLHLIPAHRFHPLAVNRAIFLSSHNADNERLCSTLSFIHAFQCFSSAMTHAFLRHARAHHHDDAFRFQMLHGTNSQVLDLTDSEVHYLRTGSRNFYPTSPCDFHIGAIQLALR